MNVLILARGGSKGVPKKNIKILNGYPLIYYVINESKKSELINDIYVSSDDDEILKISKNLGAIPIKRPTDLSEDFSLDIDSFKHFCNITNQYEPLIHLRATTPLIDYKILNESIETFKQNLDNCTSLRSAHQTPESVMKFFIKNGNFWENISKSVDSTLPRQLHINTYCPNGYIDIVKPEIFINSNDFYGDKILSFETPLSYEIDTIEDFEFIEYILRKKNNV